MSNIVEKLDDEECFKFIEGSSFLNRYLDDAIEKLVIKLKKAIYINPVTGCWEWMQTVNRDGYGLVYFINKMQSSHRVVYGLIHGFENESFELDHICNNRSCCNPDHLEEVTREENIRRMNERRQANPQCRHGHPWDGNTLINSKGYRECISCRQRAQRKYNFKIRGKVTDKYCPNGHELTKDTIYWYSDNKRALCRECKKIQATQRGYVAELQVV